MAALAEALDRKPRRRIPAREPVNRSDRVRPTRATMKRLTPDPLQILTEAEPDARKCGLMTEAADEIGKVYMAIVGALMSKRSRLFDQTPGFEDMPEKLAIAHHKRYLPWVRRCGSQMTEAVLEIVIERRPVAKPPAEQLRKALLDYWNA